MPNWFINFRKAKDIPQLRERIIIKPTDMLFDDGKHMQNAVKVTLASLSDLFAQNGHGYLENNRLQPCLLKIQYTKIIVI